MKISQEVMAVLAAAETRGNALRLVGQLERKLYVKVDEVLKAIGGKWNRKAGAHLFEEDATDLVDYVLLTGEYTKVKQDLGQFDTPAQLAAEVVDHADIEPGMKVYEPSCGIGNLIAAIIAKTGTGANIFGCEIDPKRHAKCRERHFSAFGAGGLALDNFLSIPANPVFDRVVMNPPFARFSDVEHVKHALDFLRPGGRLVSIMAAGIKFRSDRHTSGLRALIESRGGWIRDIPAGAFSSEGTSVNTCIVMIPN